MAEQAVATGAREIDVPRFIDGRGLLVAFQHGQPLPFKPVRTFVITDVPPDAHRAQHNITCDQVLWMAAGTCRALVRQSAANAAGERALHQHPAFAQGERTLPVAEHLCAPLLSLPIQPEVAAGRIEQVVACLKASLGG